MWGIIANTLAILVGSAFGILLKGGISDRFRDIIMQGLGLSVCIIGIQGAIKTSNILIVIISLIIGGTLGEWWQIEKALEKLGNWVRDKFGKNGSDSFSEGFVTASLIYCVGAMAIVGSLESGLKGENATLFAKSALDGVSAVIFSSTMGIGVAFAAFSVFIYQGFIVLTASFLKDYLSQPIINEMSAVGGVLILAIGLGMLGLRKFKVGNLLPSIFIPVFYFLILQLFHYFY
ncbi:MAG: DUF554 domain-containing protein [Clostridia bacterium]|jgi:uncharacterized membrane protein YqgA involved in biofilm formation